MAWHGMASHVLIVILCYVMSYLFSPLSPLSPLFILHAPRIMQTCSCNKRNPTSCTVRRHLYIHPPIHPSILPTYISMQQRRSSHRQNKHPCAHRTADSMRFHLQLSLIAVRPLPTISISLSPSHPPVHLAMTLSAWPGAVRCCTELCCALSPPKTLQIPPEGCAMHRNLQTNVAAHWIAAIPRSLLNCFAARDGSDRVSSSS